MSDLLIQRDSRYGWLPQHTDLRDFKFEAPSGALPASVDLRSKCPPIYDQGQLGSCTANGISAAYKFDLMKRGLPNFDPSRLFIYYNERVIEGTVRSDAGAMIRDGMKSIATVGVAPEVDWPYDISKFSRKPPVKAYRDATPHKAVVYNAVTQTPRDIKGALAMGLPVVHGFSVFSSFESQAVGNTGKVPMPSPTERSIGGHCTYLVGYVDAYDIYIANNSWSELWGIKGAYVIPQEYIHSPNLASDFWTIQTVSG